METSASIIVRAYQPKDLAALKEINYVTGLMGDTLVGKNLFNDKKLFNMLFLNYYLTYEPKNCFVAADSTTDKALGYIIGTLDTSTQEKGFTRKMFWRIALRMFFITCWRYPESFKQMVQFVTAFPKESHQKMEMINRDYPAHLHINMSPTIQSKGGGSMLMQHFLDHLKKNDVPGVHLGTMNQNTKAVPFYHKQGFQIAFEVPIKLWSTPQQQKEIIFIKSLLEE